MEQTYKIQNYIIGKEEFFNTVDLANARIKELEDEIMKLNAGRFNIIEISESPNGTLWMAPSENSPEDSTYMVFNSNFGTHENIKGRTAAYARHQELIDEFVATLKQEPQLVDQTVQPATTGTQTL